MKRTRFLIIIGVVLIFAGCRKSNTISGAGNSFSYPFYDIVLENFHKTTGIKVLYNQTSANMSIRALYNQTIDFMPVYYLPDNNTERDSSNQTLFIPYMAGAIVLAYNLPQADSINLDANVIAAIYSGKIKYWNDPLIQNINPDATLEETPITTIYRIDDPGSGVLLFNYLDEDSFQSVQGVGTKGDESIASAISDTKGAIGFLNIEHATLQNLSTAYLRNAAGNYVKADEHSISEAIKHPASDSMDISNSAAPGAYPLSTYCGILVNKNPNKAYPEKRQGLVAFLRYLLGDDIRQRATLMNYVLLPDSILLKANQLVDSIEYAAKNE